MSQLAHNPAAPPMAVQPPAAPASASLRPHRAFAGFLCVLLSIPLLVYLLTFALVMIPALGYERWGASKWGPVLDFGFHASHRDADIVVFGDSSAFLGIDPRLAEQSIHRSIVVLPNTVGSLPVTGDLALRRYLAQNKPPSLLVFYFSAWNLDYQRTAKAHFFEGEEMLLRNGTAHQIGQFIRTHPLDILAFPLQLHSTLGLRNIRQALQHSREQETAAAGGHVDYLEPYPPMTQPCRLPENYLSQRNADSVDTLVQRYAGPQTKVIVYLAPVPACANAPQLATAKLSSAPVLPPVPLTAGDFAEDGFFAHIRPDQVPAATSLFVRQLAPYLQQSMASRNATERNDSAENFLSAHSGASIAAP